MKKKALFLITLAVITIFVMIYFRFFYWSEKTLDNPKAVLPLEEKLTLTNHEETTVSFGFGYIAIINKNGELWIWGIASESSINNENDWTSLKAWLLADQVVAAVPVMDISMKDNCLYVLYEDASLWVWDN